MSRKSVSDLMISQGPNRVIGSRPDAPYDLDDAESEEWRAIVSAMAPDHFARSHYPLLAQLCRHIVASRRIAQLISAECRKKKFDRKEYAALLRMQNVETTAIIKLERTMRLTQLSVLNHTAIKKLRPVTNTLIEAPWNRKTSNEAEDEDEDDSED